jgi:hypothetical protein
MLDELQRRNYSPSTVRSYLCAVQQFAEHFHCSPEQLGPEHLRRYQVFLLREKKLELSTVEIRISALRFLYKRTLRRRDFTYDDLIFPKVPQKLPPGAQPGGSRAASLISEGMSILGTFWAQMELALLNY